MKFCMEEGTHLKPEQHDALSKLGEVELQIEFVKEMQKLNQKQLKLYSRAVRRREFEEVTKSLLSLLGLADFKNTGFKIISLNLRKSELGRVRLR